MEFIVHIHDHASIFVNDVSPGQSDVVSPSFFDPLASVNTRMIILSIMAAVL
jgi:hypothetical protein